MLEPSSNLQRLPARARASRSATNAAPDLGSSTSPFAGEVARDFTQLGFQDGKLPQQRIDALLASPQVKGHEAAVVAALDDMSKGKGVTVDDLQNYNATYAKSPDLNTTLERNFAWYCQRVDDQSPELFAHKLPNYNAVAQGHLGDCYILSPMSAATRLNPQATEKMITDDHNGNFTVAFPGQKKPVTISAPTTAQMARYCTSGADGTWASVLEKAYAVSQASPGASDPYQAIGQGGYAQGLELMTGKPYESVELNGSTPPDQQLQKIQAGLATNLPLTVVSSDDVVDAVPADHMVGLEAYNAQANAFLLRNPWGEETADSHIHDDGNGEFTIARPDFQQVFQTAYVPSAQKSA